MKTTNTYEEVPYTSDVFKDTQPSELASVATLFGMQPPRLSSCKVLELGCASGTNLMAMAQTFPDGEFVGIDFSARQIQEGQAKLQILGFPNVSLKHLSILDVTPELGQFDYIVVHGVYSWVPPLVQEKILQICHANLVPNGVAYVSYNTYPGWYLNRALREMMLYHTQSSGSAPEKIGQAKGFLQFLAAQLQMRVDPYCQLLEKQLDYLQEERDDYIFHEYLEENNEPLFFYQFVERARQQGLQFLAEMDKINLVTEAVSSDLTLALSRLEEPLRREQYADFLTFRSFRKTLLCHAPVATGVTPPALSKFHFAMPAGRNVSTDLPMVKAVCQCLGERWPQSLSFRELEEAVTKRFKGLDWSAEAVIHELLPLCLQRQIEFSLSPLVVSATVSSHPLATPLARLQAQRRDEVTNLRFENFSFDAATCSLLGQLDGTRDIGCLSGQVLGEITQGKFTLGNDSEKDLHDLHHLHLKVSEWVAKELQRLANLAFLVT